MLLIQYITGTSSTSLEEIKLIAIATYQSFED